MTSLHPTHTGPLASSSRHANNYTNRVTSLGIPVDNINLGEAVDHILAMIEQYQVDKTPKLVATLNVQFLVNALGYRFSKPRHPELIDILRSADLVTADGFPIVLLSKLSGFPLKERVTGADLMPALCQRAAQSGASVYLLGGLAGSADKAAQKLSIDYPALVVAGTACPDIAIEGKKLASADEDDRLIVERINASGAKILFLALGNPKQELWFSRNKHRLQVAVTLGIGGTFEFITGQVKRAPLWVQNMNLEWLYRLSQDPKRLLSRYVIGIAKLGVLSMPLLLSRLKQQLIPAGNATHQNETAIVWKTHWAAKDDVLMTLRLPVSVSRPYMETLVQTVITQAQSAQSNKTFLLDFSQVKQFDLAGYDALCALIMVFSQNASEGLIVGLSKKMQRHLRSARVMDLIANHCGNYVDIEKQTIHHSPKTRFSMKSYTAGSVVFTYLQGSLSGRALSNTGLVEALANAARDRECIIDVRETQHVDSTAIASLVKLAQLANKGVIKQFYLGGVTPQIQQMLKITKASHLIKCLPDAKFYDRLFK